MFASDVMSFGESLIISALGLSIVFIALVVLAIMILIFSKIFEAIIPKEVPVKAEVKKPAVEPNNDEEYAVLVAAAHEEMRTLKGKFRITSIKEVK